MLTNAMNFKKNYGEAIEEVGMQIVEAITALELAGDETHWEEISDKGSISIKDLVIEATGEEVRYSNIDFQAVHDFLSIYSDSEICSNNNSVMEELEEVFDVFVDEDDIILLLDYDQKFLMEYSENYN